jgi:uncharacterized protein
MSPALAHEVDQLKEAQDAVAARRYAAGLKILRRLADDDNPRATWMLGGLYATGRGVHQDLSKARALWEKAAASGHPNAMCSLAILVHAGIGGPAEPKRPMELFEKSANRGYAYALGVSML